MRIKEEQLRRIIEGLIREAPLADVFPTKEFSLGADEPRAKYASPDPMDTATAKRVFGSKGVKAFAESVDESVIKAVAARIRAGAWE